MRKVSAKRILDEYITGDYTFTPIPDNGTVFENYEQRAQEGKLARLVSPKYRVMLVMFYLFEQCD